MLALELEPPQWVTLVAGLYTNTLLLTALSTLWVYDWMLTLLDEIEYAWQGRKTWAFALYLANRYFPGFNIIYVNIVMFAELETWLVSCHSLRWFPSIQANLVTIFSQIAIALRVYAVTGKNKWLCSPLVLLLAVELVAEFIVTVLFLREPDQTLPEEILRLFRLCTHKRWKPGALVFVNLALAFDILAFAIIAYRIKKELPTRSLGITTLWNVILRDATLYFVVITFTQFFSLLFMFTTPESIQLIPAAINSILVPIMATRLMLSLKSAAANPAEEWSVRTMSYATGPIIVPGDGNTFFAARNFDATIGGASDEVSDDPTTQDGNDLELAPIP